MQAKFAIFYPKYPYKALFKKRIINYIDTSYTIRIDHIQIMYTNSPKANILLRCATLLLNPWQILGALLKIRDSLLWLGHFNAVGKSQCKVPKFCWRCQLGAGYRPHHPSPIYGRGVVGSISPPPFEGDIRNCPSVYKPPTTLPHLWWNGLYTGWHYLTGVSAWYSHIFGPNVDQLVSITVIHTNSFCYVYHMTSWMW